MVFGRKPRASRSKSLMTIAGGVLSMYFFDPQMGKARRAVVRDKAVKLFNRGSTKAERASRYVGSQAYGVKQKIAHLGSDEATPPNDPALVAKVQTEIGQLLGPAKGKINIDATEGIVYLRGQLDDESQIGDVEQAVRKVTGVVDVRNLIHLPGQPAPTV